MCAVWDMQQWKRAIWQNVRCLLIACDGRQFVCDAKVSTLLLLALQDKQAAGRVEKWQVFVFDNQVKKLGRAVLFPLPKLMQP